MASGRHAALSFSSSTLLLDSSVDSSSLRYLDFATDIDHGITSVLTGHYPTLGAIAAAKKSDRVMAQNQKQIILRHETGSPTADFPLDRGCSCRRRTGAS
jgi:hypothetical protein